MWKRLEGMEIVDYGQGIELSLQLQEFFGVFCESIADVDQCQGDRVTCLLSFGTHIVWVNKYEGAYLPAMIMAIESP